jgi:hypothetical protein
MYDVCWFQLSFFKLHLPVLQFHPKKLKLLIKAKGDLTTYFTGKNSAEEEI